MELYLLALLALGLAAAFAFAIVMRGLVTVNQQNLQNKEAGS